MGGCSVVSTSAHFLLMEDLDNKLRTLHSEMEEAVRKQSSIREASFLPVTFEVVGIEVNQFTPYHYALLDFAGSPFVAGEGKLTAGHIVEFLWVIATDKAKEKIKKEIDTLHGEDVDTFKAFSEWCSHFNFEEAVNGIVEYYSNAFLDAPKGDGNKKSGPSKFAWICHYIDALAREYHWDDQKILHMPFARILQYMRKIEEREWNKMGKEAPLENKLTDKIQTQIISTLIAKAKHEQEKKGQ